jgi:hypothetical protein
MTDGRRRGARYGRVASAAVLLLTLGCAGRALDLGSDSEASGGTGSNTPKPGGAGASPVEASAGQPTKSPPSGGSGASCTAATSGWPDPAECLPAPDSDLVGTWKGHWPFTYEVDGDAVLQIDGLTADGAPCGTLTIGEGPALPPATDPDAPYPPSSGAPNGMDFNPSFGSAKYGIFAGHSYPLTQVVSSGSRLAFLVPTKDPWRGWCGLQPAIPGEPTCVRLNQSYSDPSGCYDGAGVPIPCAKYFLCGVNSACSCANGCCDADPSSGDFVDLHWDGGALEGSVNSSAPIYLDPVD